MVFKLFVGGVVSQKKNCLSECFLMREKCNLDKSGKKTYTWWKDKMQYALFVATNLVSHMFLSFFPFPFSWSLFCFITHFNFCFWNFFLFQSYIAFAERDGNLCNAKKTGGANWRNITWKNCEASFFILFFFLAFRFTGQLFKRDS